MFYEKYGNENSPIIVFLHGANFVHTFGRQYTLSDKFCIYVPHILGYGNEANKIFNTENTISELTDFICSLGKKVMLIGFSLGAQLAVKFISQHSELIEKAIIVSPWLIKQEPELSNLVMVNEKQLASMKNPFKCNLIGFMNGLPKTQRKEFVEQMQNVQFETAKNAVNNGITLETIDGFEKANMPMIAIAGSKEQKSVIDSIKLLAQLNSNCRFEVWEKAAHNIPPLFSKRFNKLICDFADIQ